MALYCLPAHRPRSLEQSSTGNDRSSAWRIAKDGARLNNPAYTGARLYRACRGEAQQRLKQNSTGMIGEVFDDHLIETRSQYTWVL